MPRIFISYRRSDGRSATERLSDRLIATFGKSNIFQDVDSIPPGEDFRKYIQKQIRNADFLLVVIGQRWLSATNDAGARRLDDPQDFVRIEVETGLQLGKPVIPVLVDGAPMPKLEDLPISLQDFAYKNAAPLRYNPDFERDVQKLIDAISNFDFSNFLLEKVGIYDLMPQPFDWCTVPTGFSDHLQIQEVVKTYRISKYPVTNSQFQLFLDDPDGYGNEEWWTGSQSLHLWRKNHPVPLTPRFAKPNHPRENVTWYEAMAYCRWLGDKTQSKIELPTVAQHARAAFGDDHRVYPWGNEFSSSRCNTRENMIDRTTPVDRYPDGVSPFGVYDLSGNVWQWTATSAISSSTPNIHYVVLGGGWRSRRRHTRKTFSRLHEPEYFAPDVGFRIIQVEP